MSAECEYTLLQQHAEQSAAEDPCQVSHDEEYMDMNAYEVVA